MTVRDNACGITGKPNGPGIHAERTLIMGAHGNLYRDEEVRDGPMWTITLPGRAVEVHPQ